MGKRIIRKLGLITSIIFMCTGFFILYEIFAPELAFRIDKPDEKKIIEYIKSNVELTENRLIIPSIGVDMEIGEDKEFLDFGGWVQGVNNDGRPNLIAVHRFGFNSFTAGEKVKQTLYHVNKLKNGDRVFTIWNGKNYEYKVKDVIDGTNNPSSEYLTIYTCKFYSSKQRVFINLTH